MHSATHKPLQLVTPLSRPLGTTGISGTIAVPALFLSLSEATKQKALAQPPVHAPGGCVWLSSLKSPFLFCVRVFPFVHLGGKHFQRASVDFFFPVQSTVDHKLLPRFRVLCNAKHIIQFPFEVPVNTWRDLSFHPRPPIFDKKFCAGGDLYPANHLSPLPVY